MTSGSNFHPEDQLVEVDLSSIGESSLINKDLAPVGKFRRGAKRTRVSRHGQGAPPGDGRAVPDADTQLCRVRGLGVAFGVYAVLMRKRAGS